MQAIFGLLSPAQDGCQDTMGPLWLHFVVTGNIRTMELMIQNGADLSLSSEVWDNHKMRPFNAMDVAIRKDERMADLLRRAGAPGGIWGRNRFGSPPPAINHPSGNSWQSKAGVDASVDPHCS